LLCSNTTAKDQIMLNLKSSGPLRKSVALSVQARVGVVRANGAFSVIALSPISLGETILLIEGRTINHPSMYSVQVGDEQHVELPPNTTGGDDLDTRLWQYLNHSCDPSAAIVDRALIALRPMTRGDAITFDYNTTEYDIASPFTCACGSCSGRVIRGFKHLTHAEQMDLAPRLASYLRSKILADGVS